MTKLADYVVNQFRGLNLDIDASNVDDSEFVTLTNMYIDTAGTLVLREGTIDYQVSDGLAKSTIFIDIASSTTTLEIVNNSGSGVIQVFLTQLNPTVLASSSSFAWEPYGGFSYNSVYYLLTTSGIYSVNLTTAVPTLVYSSVILAPGCLYKDRYFGFNGNTVYYSEVGNVVSYPAANFFKVQDELNEVITGIIPIAGDRLLIFKRKSIYILFAADADPATWELKFLSGTAGTLSSHTLAEYKGSVFFLGAEGMYRTDGVNVVPISTNLNNAFTNATQYAGRQPAPQAGYGLGVQGYFGVVYQDFYLCTTAQGTFCYNIVNDTWSLWVFGSGGASYFTKSSEKSNTNILYFISGGGGSSTRSTLLGYTTSRNHGSAATYPQNIPCQYRDGVKRAWVTGDPNSVVANSYAYTATLKSKDINLGSNTYFKRFKNIIFSVIGYCSLSYVNNTDGAQNYTTPTTPNIARAVKFKIFSYRKSTNFTLTITPTLVTPNGDVDYPDGPPDFALLDYTIKTSAKDYVVKQVT